MDDSWPKLLLEVVNAAGVPLLALAVVVLLRAYNRQGAAYRETADFLRSENTRLREHLGEADAFYAAEVKRLRELAAKSAEVIGQLEARKIVILSGQIHSLGNVEEVEKINEAIRAIQQLSLLPGRLDLALQQNSLKVLEEVQTLTARIGVLAQEVGDFKGKLAILSVVTSKATLEEVGDELKDVPKERVYISDIRARVDALPVSVYQEGRLTSVLATDRSLPLREKESREGQDGEDDV